MLNIVLFGAPGSGKGTQSAKLIDEYGLYHISTGELLRDHIKRGTPLGKTADEYISKGQLIPDQLMIDILDDVLEKEASGKSGVVFDGFPRTIPQAEALKELLRKRGTDLHAVIGLEVPEEELVNRMLARGKETGRADDNIETIKNRLDVYHNQTMPLRDYYTNEKKYLAINGLGIVDEIFRDIADQLERQTGVKSRKSGK
jgi:adenylate kinase